MDQGESQSYAGRGVAARLRIEERELEAGGLS